MGPLKLHTKFGVLALFLIVGTQINQAHGQWFNFWGDSEAKKIEKNGKSRNHIYFNGHTLFFRKAILFSLILANIVQLFSLEFSEIFK